MGSRQHPLDVFRASGDGFDKASRRRRTVPGKVVATSLRKEPGGADPPSTRTSVSAAARSRPEAAARPVPPRQAPRPAPAPGGSTLSRSAAPGKPRARAERLRRLASLVLPSGAGKRSQSARRADRSARGLLFGAAAVLAAIALIIVFKQHGLDLGGAELPVLRLQDVLEPAPGMLASGAPVEQPVVEWWTIQAAVYNGSRKGLDLAYAAQEELIRRGVPLPTVIGHEAAEPAAGEGQGFESYELVVGKARTAEELTATLEGLLSIADWPGGKAAPFVSARIIPHPCPEALAGASDSDG